MDFLASAGVKMCFVSAGTNTALHCSYVINGEDIVSDASLGSPFAFLAFLIDPLILQVPDAASNFSGTFSGSSITGNLSITEVPGTLPADISTVIAPSRYQADDRGFPESAAILMSTWVWLLLTAATAWLGVYRLRLRFREAALR